MYTHICRVYMLPAVKNCQRTFNLMNQNNVSQMQQSLQQQLVSTVMACVLI